MFKHLSLLLLLSLISFGLTLSSQASPESVSNNTFTMPATKLLRAEEDYSFLASVEESLYRDNFWDSIKYISLGDKAFLSLGGEFRPRYESYTNRRWANQDEDFYSQRLSLYANLRFNSHWRIYNEFVSGYTSHVKEFAEYDELAWLQGFVEYTQPIKAQRSVNWRIGRQEMPFGSARLVGMREGLNIRRSFDAARAIYKYANGNIHLFYGKEVRPNFHVLDNDFTLLDSNARNPRLWGVYSQFKLANLFGNNELYYLGFESDSSRFNDVLGKEKRHSVGLRRFGRLGQGFSYNTELTYQFGDIGSSDISAYNIEGDWQYQWRHKTWKPKFGMKLEWSSGDRDANDNEINTFNPMFVNPAYYSLSLTMTPANTVSFHPSITVYPNEKLSIYLEWATFRRESRDDGLYSPPRFLVRNIKGVRDKEIGDQIGLQIKYEINRFWSFDIESSYFIAGDYLEQSGSAEDIFHISPTIRFKF